MSNFEEHQVCVIVVEGIETTSISQTSEDQVRNLFFNPFMPGVPGISITPVQLQQVPPSALAYVGDAVFELYVRSYFLFPSQRAQAYHRQVVSQVRAERQATHLQVLEHQLTETERDIVRRGRNAAPRGPKRLDPVVYQKATSFETLIGYLYLSDPQRLYHLLSHLEMEDSDSLGLRGQ